MTRRVATGSLPKGVDHTKFIGGWLIYASYGLMAWPPIDLWCPHEPQCASIEHHFGEVPV